MAAALLLIDFQRDFLMPNGRMPVAENQVAGLITAANLAFAAAYDRGDLIVTVGNEFPRSSVIANFFRRYAAMAGSSGSEWDERIPAGHAKYFKKWRGDAFCNPELEPFLRQHDVREVSLAGVYAKGCVTATAKGAMARGFKTNVLADAVADSSDRTRESALRTLARHGANIVRSRKS